MKHTISKEIFEHNKTKTYKYIDIGNVEKELGQIIGYEEDILFNLPTRARQSINANDILQPRPIGSLVGTTIVTEEYNNNLASTGFIVIETENYNDAVLIRSVLTSEIVQKQMFYLQSGSIQPEITPTNFKKHVLLPIPCGILKKKVIRKYQKQIKEAFGYKEEYKYKMAEAKSRFIELVNSRLLIKTKFYH